MATVLTAATVLLPLLLLLAAEGITTLNEAGARRAVCETRGGDVDSRTTDTLAVQAACFEKCGGDNFQASVAAGLDSSSTATDEAGPGGGEAATATSERTPYLFNVLDIVLTICNKFFLLVLLLLVR
ncbi:unnamed protein product [Linum trigynum]|uniref:Uncharacterized protein n=1 Tax=Linum trigynum TaxID=586398 RepID=A0AAV2G086_9ROSI